MQIEKRKQNDRVMILGTASSLKLVNWDEPDYDIWACSPVVTQPCAKPNIDKINVLFNCILWNTG